MTSTVDININMLTSTLTLCHSRSLEFTSSASSRSMLSAAVFSLVVAATRKRSASSAVPQFAYVHYFSGAWDTTWQVHAKPSAVTGHKVLHAQRNGLLQLSPANSSLPNVGPLTGLSTEVAPAYTPARAAGSAAGEFADGGTAPTEDAGDGLSRTSLKMECESRTCNAGVFRLVGYGKSADFFRFNFVDMPGLGAVSHAEWFGAAAARVPALVGYGDAVASKASSGEAAVASAGTCTTLIVSADQFVVSFYSGGGDAALVTVLSARRREGNKWPMWLKIAILVSAAVMPIWIGMRKVAQGSADAMRLQQLAAELQSSRALTGARLASNQGGKKKGKRRA